MEHTLHQTIPKGDDQLSSSDMSISVESSYHALQPQASSSFPPAYTPSPTHSVLSFRSSGEPTQAALQFYPSNLLPHMDNGKDGQQVLREAHGRKFNAQNAVWMLPADSEEHNRMDIQHIVLTEALGSLYTAPDLVQQALAPRQRGPPGILDIGTGSGSWALDMAKEFSHADVVGIDLVPPTVQGPVPSNIRFEIDDVNLSLTHYTKCFDVVHCRSVDPGIDDFRGFIYSLAQVLRPNGVLLLVRGSSQFFDEHLRPIPTVDEGSPGFFALQNIFMAIDACFRLRWGTQRPPLAWKDWLEDNPNYTKVGTLAMHVPVGAWQSGLDPKMQRIAELNRYNAHRILRSFRPLLLEGGCNEVVADRWIERASKDLENGTSRIYSRWEYAWAIRRNTKWRPPPETQKTVGVN